MDLGDYFHLDESARRIVIAEQRERQGVRRWQCPKCCEEMETLASDVGHRCAKNGNRMTSWNVIGRG